MNKKHTKIVGLSFSDFNSLVEKGKEIHLQTARLIPFYKPGDEMALTSIFLSALRLVEEFRKNISQEINLIRSGTIYVFTEATFSSCKKPNRPDGLILIVKGKNIVDAALVEVKNKGNELDDNQISQYLTIAKEYNIPKLLTVSNQFVSFPTQSPLSIKVPKHVSLYHLSWSYILTIAHLLLFKNGKNEENIFDKDQVEIMNEVVEYFESDISGILGFTQMKQGWTNIVDKVSTDTALDLCDNSVDETISSWLQEERDMALILSRKLGEQVFSGLKKYRDNLRARIDYEKKKFISNKCLESILQITGAASQVFIRSNFEKKSIEMSVELSAPQDRKTKARISWINNQIKTCEKKNPELFARLKNDLLIDINIKYSNQPNRFRLDEMELTYDKFGNKEVKGFNIVLIRNLGIKFKSRKGFVDAIEKMLIDYYQGIVQYLKKWEKPAPQINKSIDDSDEI